MVNTAASKVIENKWIVYNRAVKWWDEEVKEAIRLMRETHARYIPHRVQLRQDGRSMLQLEKKRKRL